MSILVWFRRDLRCDDNPALRSAFQAPDPVIPVYIHDPDEQYSWKPGAASNWYLKQSLLALEKELAARGLKLKLLRGAPADVLCNLAHGTGARKVLWNRIYEPEWVLRDRAVIKKLDKLGLEIEVHHDHSLFQPGSVRNGAGTAYKVFTPFWKKLEPRLVHANPECLDTGKQVMQWPSISPPLVADSLSLDSLGLTGSHSWHNKLLRYWSAGESSAREALSRILKQVEAYPDERDFPYCDGTSQLSTALHFGEISPWRIIHALQPAWSGERGNAASRGAAALARQFGWREFAIHLLHAYPDSPGKSIRQEFENNDLWASNDAYLEAWQSGSTGFPLVDAGMRQLWETGWMHNRVRMITASFLTKQLGQHWHSGARWFWDKLVDADLASNTMGWQWVAGCGCDAAPYYRIFNPERQAQRFDPGEKYIRRWLDTKKSPHPAIIDLPGARDSALQRYKQLRKSRATPAPY